MQYKKLQLLDQEPQPPNRSAIQLIQETPFEVSFFSLSVLVVATRSITTRTSHEKDHQKSNSC